METASTYFKKSPNQVLTPPKLADENINIQLYPNPTADYLFISGLEALETICLVNLNGEKIKELDSSKLYFDVREIPAGCYQIMLTTHTGENIFKTLIKI